MSRLKVLFHVNENPRWPRVIVNVRNFIKDVGQGQADIEIVANGAAVTAYGNAPEEDLHREMQELAALGVVFAACRNALNMHSLDEKSLPPFVRVVPAGITEIAQKQSQGYAYIKP